MIKTHRELAEDLERHRAPEFANFVSELLIIGPRTRGLAVNAWAVWFGIVNIIVKKPGILPP